MQNYLKSWECLGKCAKVGQKTEEVWENVQEYDKGLESLQKCAKCWKVSKSTLKVQKAWESEQNCTKRRERMLKAEKVTFATFLWQHIARFLPPLKKLYDDFLPLFCLLRDSFPWTGKFNAVFLLFYETAFGCICFKLQSLLYEVFSILNFYLELKFQFFLQYRRDGYQQQWLCHLTVQQVSRN